MEYCNSPHKLSHSSHPSYDILALGCFHEIRFHSLGKTPCLTNGCTNIPLSSLSALILNFLRSPLLKRFALNSLLCTDQDPVTLLRGKYLGCGHLTGWVSNFGKVRVSSCQGMLPAPSSGTLHLYSSPYGVVLLCTDNPLSVHQ